MQSNQPYPRLSLVQALSGAWKKWQRRRARLAEFDNADMPEMQHVARDLGTSVPELRILVGHGENAADLLKRRLLSLNVDTGTIEPAVMRDLQRCCSQCSDKVLCVHELEDRPKTASWPKYCPNEQTIEALIAEGKR